MIHFGADYYPEQWEEERWEIDSRLMAEAGFTVVRLAEFAWAKMEPSDGIFDFDWLDRAIGVLWKKGIQVVLGTPTASPPTWVMSANPEAYRVAEDGRRVTYGNRREYCPTNSAYREFSRRIVTRMAEHYADHPAVIGWQIDNEFGDRCYCPICCQGFHKWLQKHYTSLDELNEKWGTIFWSHTYTDWKQIPAPLTSGGSPNPGLALDYFRFCSDTYTAYQQLQLEILRKHCPSHFITHNFMGFGYDKINYFDLARPLDFIAWDNYQRHQWDMKPEINYIEAALSQDTMRGLKHRSYWVMEQQGGPGGWEYVSVGMRPGELRLLAYQSIAHGADGIVFFRWRTARYGTEQYWHGLLNHDGSTGRRYTEIKRMGAELKKIGKVVKGAAVKAQAALLLSYDSRFAFQIQGNNPRFRYNHHWNEIYSALYANHTEVEIISEQEVNDGYRLIIVPSLHILTPQVAEALTHYVEKGGVLLITSRSGVKDWHNAVVNQPLPGLLSKLCGVEVEDYDSLAPQMSNQVRFTQPLLVDTPPTEVNIWCDILNPTTAEVIATYTKDFYAGKPAATLNQYGKGKVIYAGTLGGSKFFAAMVSLALKLAQVPPALPGVPQGVEVTRRWQGVTSLVFLLNTTLENLSIPLPGAYTDLLYDKVLQGKITLAPLDVSILRED